MAEINKIRLNGNDYDIVPQLGTGLVGNDGVVGINIGKGLSFDDKGKLRISFGTGLVCENENEKMVVNLGTAQVLGNSSANCGIAISDLGFVINPVDFKNYLASLGVMFK